ncbi:MAG: ROK family protein [Thermoplasmata archaeon]|nr:ROK family protein [Thermoplasmata archaeon]
MKRSNARTSRRVLVLDIGGSHVGVAISPGLKELRIPADPKMDPARMLKLVRAGAKGQRFDVVSIGYPGLVVHGRIVREPYNLAGGWVGFRFEKAFRKPTRILNDAAMQALGSYRGGRMLFLGLGTGLGSAMVVDGLVEPMEIAHLPYRKGKTYEEFVGERALLRRGKRKWQKDVFGVVATLSNALEPDYVVLGGGNVRKLKTLPPKCRRGNNRNAFRGGVLLWANRPTPRPRA